MQGGVLAGTELGLVEIEQEIQTQDGYAGGGYDAQSTVSAADGILLGYVFVIVRTLLHTLLPFPTRRAIRAFSHVLHRAPSDKVAGSCTRPTPAVLQRRSRPRWARRLWSARRRPSPWASASVRWHRGDSGMLSGHAV